jgi:putative DNA methylase
MTVTRKKLIEVALPLEAINEEGSLRKRKAPGGYPTMLHKWWAQRPVAAARAVVFAQMVDDPSTYVETLLRDPALKRRAERELKERQALWRRRSQAWQTAQAAGNSAIHSPGEPPTLTECAAELERERLFEIMRELVKWDNTNNEPVLQSARDEIWQSWRRACADNADHPRAADLFRRDKLPAFHDPFGGSGAMPLEAQRLGLEAHASDLNPVAVLINKAMIEIPPKFYRRSPVNPDAQMQRAQMDKGWQGAQGLAEDVRYYGHWMRDEAAKRIGHLYPKVDVTAQMIKERPDLKPYLGRQLNVIAWLWARTVRSPNPAFADVEVPLASTFMLSTKAGKEAYVEPIVEGDRYRFTVKIGAPKDMAVARGGTKLARGANFRCLMSDVPIAGDYIKAEGRAGRMGAKLMAIVADGDRSRIYLSPTDDHEAAAAKAKPIWQPDTELAPDLRALWTPPYGLKTYGDLFTPRQLVALSTFTALVGEAIARVRSDAVASGMPDDGKLLRDSGSHATAYAEAVAVYLAFALDRTADYSSSIATWRPKDSAMRSTLAKQAIPMSWDFAEGSPFGASSSGFAACVDVVASVVSRALGMPWVGKAVQANASDAPSGFGTNCVTSTDPPYYDNIGYADLSDYFYVWLRACMRTVFPDLFATLAVPKAEELVATPYRHGGKENAEAFFLAGMTRAMQRLAENAHPAYPVTIYYAFKQTESESDTGTASTGWETFLDAVIRAGFCVTGTWPMRTEGDNRQVGIGNNALASSIVLVCRPRVVSTPTATRREFLAAMKAELPAALIHLQRGNIAPVDLAQAAIGPGMAVYTRYAKVIDAEGNALTVREALAFINQTLDEALAEQEGDFDADSRFAITWFDQMGFAEGEFGQANVLAQAKNTGMDGLVEAGIIRSARGKVRLLKPDELPADWDPAQDTRLTAWETVHQLVRALESGGEGAAAALVSRLGIKAEAARELAYRLYSLCERRKRAAEALSYNALVQSWPQIVELAKQVAPVLPDPTQADLI